MAMHESIAAPRSSDPAKFGAFVRQAMSLITDESDKLSFVERTRLLVFFINAIKSLENSVVWIFVTCLSWIWVAISVPLRKRARTPVWDTAAVRWVEHGACCGG
jgi:hypothetical protein